MPNHYFQFKKFTVYQDQCSMKVCTDACFFGAWVAEKILKENLILNHVLDIGAGTGLLSLMLSQKITAQFDAVEIDINAAQQAKQNFQSSLWAEQLNLIHDDIRSFTLSKKYDLIISNPPFFENDLTSPDAKRNMALHSSELSFENLLFIVKNALDDHGVFAVLLPHHRTEAFIISAEKQNLFVSEIVLVKQTENHPYFRSILWLTTSRQKLQITELVIKENGDYSPPFKNLLQEYYLHL